MLIVDALISRVRNDYSDAKSIAGYLKRRLLEKGTWVSIGAAVAAAASLPPIFAAGSILAATIVALLPTP